MSSTWRSILAGREVLRKGLIRRIGDGTMTQIWWDSWLPDHFSWWPLTPAEGNFVETVSDLTTDSGAWNEELIRDIFFPVDAAAILKLPLVPRGEDIWAWAREKHGIYSMKTTYRVQEDMQSKTMRLGTEMCRVHRWRLIWKLEVPPKVKVFWWRVMHDFLPAKQVVHRRHLEPTAHCETCGSGRESVRHVLTECTIARIFWEQTKRTTVVKLPDLHPVSWASDLLNDRVCSKKRQSGDYMWDVVTLDVEESTPSR